MGNRSNTKTKLFLLELILAIFFFSIASAVCVQLFARAHLLSAHAEALNGAVLCAENLAAKWSAAPEDTELLQYYDIDWNVCSPEASVYTAEIAVTEEASVSQAVITIYETENPETVIYTLETALHHPYTIQEDL